MSRIRRVCEFAKFQLIDGGKLTGAHGKMKAGKTGGNKRPTQTPPPRHRQSALKKDAAAQLGIRQASHPIHAPRRPLATRRARSVAASPNTGGERGIRTPGRLLHLRRFSKALLSTTQPSLRVRAVERKTPTAKRKGDFRLRPIYRASPPAAFPPAFPLHTRTPPTFL